MIVYIEIPAPKYEESKKFYSEVFGWDIKDSEMEPGNPYAICTLKGEYGLDGVGLDSTLKPIPSGTNYSYIGVDDIPATLDKIKNAGGEIVKEKADIGGGHGFYAFFKDVNGSHFGLWSKT